MFVGWLLYPRQPTCVFGGALLPDVEIERLTARIRERTAQGWSTAWHEARLKQLRKMLEAQAMGSPGHGSELHFALPRLV